MIGTYYRLSLADEDVGADKAESNSICSTITIEKRTECIAQNSVGTPPAGVYSEGKM